MDTDSPQTPKALKLAFLTLLAQRGIETAPEEVESTTDLSPRIEAVRLVLARLDSTLTTWETGNFGDGWKIPRAQYIELVKTVEQVASTKDSVKAEAPLEELEVEAEATAKSAAETVKAYVAWTDAAAKLLPLVERALKHGRGQPDKIRGVWAYAHGKEQSGDPAGALKAIGPLTTLLKEAEEAKKTQVAEDVEGMQDMDLTKAQLLAARFQSAQDKLVPLVEAALKKNVTDRSAIEVAWALAHERAESGTQKNSVEELTSALQILLEVKRLLDNAQVEPLVPEGTVQSAKDRLNADTALKAANVLLNGTRKAAKKVEDRLTEAFKPKVPDTVAAQILKVTQILAKDDETDPTKVELAATTGGDELVKLEEMAKKLLKEKAEWERALSLFGIRMITLGNHAQAAEVTTVAPLLTALADDRDKAALKATAHDWVGAVTAINLLFVRCDEAEATADALAQYTTVHDERAALITPLPDPVDVEGLKPKAAVVAAKKLYTDAEIKKTAKKYTEAIELLNQIPAAAKLAAKLAEDSKWYSTAYAKYLSAVGTLNGYDAEVKKVTKDGIAAYKKMVEDAHVDETGDYVKSRQLLDLAGRYYGSVKTLSDQVKTYLDALTAFDLRLTEVKDHAGRIAIEDYYARLTDDKKFAADKAKANEFFLATTILDGSKPPLQVEQIKIAVIGEKYVAKKKQVDDEIIRLEKLTNAGQAAAVLTDAKAHVSAAGTAATAKKWQAALDSYLEAEKRLVVADKVLTADTELGTLKDTGKLDNIATAFEAAYGVYEAMFNHVTSKDDGTFTKLLATAKVPALRAKAQSTASAPDYGEARKDLNEAIKICEDALVLVTRKPAYDLAWTALETQHTTTLPALQEDNCIKKLLAAIDVLLKAAAALVKPDTFDYTGAAAKVTEGQALVEQATVAAAAYKKLKPQRTEIDNAILYLKHATRKAGVDKEILKLEGLAKTITDAVLAEDIPAAAKAAAEGAKLCDPYKAIGDAYIEAAKIRKEWILDRKASIEGKAVCDPELKELEALITTIDEHFTIRAYAASINVCRTGYWVIEAGKAIIAEAAAYEIERGKAESKLAEVKNVVNAGVQTAYDALDQRYKDGVVLATARNYLGATKVMTPIPLEAHPLLAIAQAYKAYDLSKTAADVALNTATTDENAPAIKPLLTHLAGRRTTALKLATETDYAGAKKAFDELLEEAKAALKAATEHGVLTNLAGSIKTLTSEDASGLTAAIQKATELRTELLGEPGSKYAVGTMNQAHELLKTAGTLKDSDVPKAKEALGQAVDLCAKARLEMGHYAQLEAEAASLTKSIKALLSTHAQADFVRPTGETLLANIAAALDTALSTGSHEVATTTLTETGTAAHALALEADAHAAYVKRRGEVTPHLEEMEKVAHRYTIKTEIADFRKDVTDAAGKVEAHDHKAAMKLLESAMEAYHAANLKAKMAGDTKPTVDDVNNVLGQKDGSAKLDGIIDGLEPTAQRKVLRVAMEARFGCKLNIFPDSTKEKAYKKWLDDHPNASELQKEQKLAFYSEDDGTKKGPNVRRFYQAMSGLPNTHTKENDSLKIFTEVGGVAAGSDYGGGRKEITMREGDGATSPNYRVAQKHEVEPDDDSKPVDGPPTTFFNWNTLHEVGHAVDDKLGFMKKRGNELGGWVEYVGNVLPIADAIAKKYGFDKAYVAVYMSGQADPPIPDPVGVEFDEWERRRVACRQHVDRARSTKNPWSTTSAAKSLEIDGIVYQESYPDHWSSYPLAQRAKGVTGYQFRAPGEWFSELYAAFHSKKLNPSHPARAWLAGL